MADVIAWQLVSPAVPVSPPGAPAKDQTFVITTADRAEAGALVLAGWTVTRTWPCLEGLAALLDEIGSHPMILLGDIIWYAGDAMFLPSRSKNHFVRQLVNQGMLAPGGGGLVPTDHGRWAYREWAYAEARWCAALADG